MSDEEPTPHFGLIAWLLVVLAIISILFIILDWENLTGDVLVLTLQLSIGLGAAAMMGEDVRRSLTTTKGQANVLIWGIIGGSALLMLSQVLWVAWQVVAFAGIGSAGLVVLAPVVETLIWEYVLFGTFWYIGSLLQIVKWLRFLVTAIPSAMIFALWHYWVYGTMLLPLIVLFSGSLLLKAIYAKTDDAGTPMLAHLFNNVFAIMGTVAIWFAAFWWVLVIPVVLVLLYLLCSKGGTLD